MNCTLMHLKSKTRKIFGFRSAYVAVLDVLPSTSGAPGEARTPNLLIRSQALCPIELRGLHPHYTLFTLFLAVFVTMGERCFHAQAYPY